MARIDFDRIKRLIPLATVLPRSALDGRCPFCGEHAFGVHVESGLFNCQRCDAEGDVVHAVMALEGLDLRTAVARLHDRAAEIEHLGRVSNPCGGH